MNPAASSSLSPGSMELAREDAKIPITARLGGAEYPGMYSGRGTGTEKDRTRSVLASHIGIRSRTKETRPAIDHETGWIDA